MFILRRDFYFGVGMRVAVQKNYTSANNSAQLRPPALSMFPTAKPLSASPSIGENVRMILRKEVNGGFKAYDCFDGGSRRGPY